MSRRGYNLSWRCAENGCREMYFSHVDYKSDYTDAWKRQSAKPWKCLRHRCPEEWLTTERTSITTEIPMQVAEHGQLWGNFGQVRGPGFMANANDFPPGTRLVVCASVILPADAEGSGQ